MLNNCDPITNLKDAQKPIVTVLLPVKGLRHDAEGEVTEDGVNIVMDGIKNLGITVTGEDLKTVVIAETKKVVSTLNAQYEFLIAMLISSMNNSEVPSKLILDLVKEKNTAMRDVLSISRQILSKRGSGSEFVEGFVNNSGNGATLKRALEAFKTMNRNLETDADALKEQRYSDIKRNYDISVEKTKSVSSNLAIYSFLNVVAVGLLFYIVSVK